MSKANKKNKKIKVPQSTAEESKTENRESIISGSQFTQSISVDAESSNTRASEVVQSKDTIPFYVLDQSINDEPFKKMDGIINNEQINDRKFFKYLNFNIIQTVNLMHFLFIQMTWSNNFKKN